MNEIIIKFTPESVEAEGEKIIITAEIENSEAVLYKFMIGYEGKWNVLREFDLQNTVEWIPESLGNYMIMVQGKLEDSKKPYNYVSKANYIVGKEEKELTNETQSEEEEMSKADVETSSKVEIGNFMNLTGEMLVGNELIFEVDASCEDCRTILYKFIKINSQGVGTCVQDYSTKKIVSYVEDFSGDYKLLCMAKDMYSTEKFDDRAIISYTVKPYRDVHIKSFISDVSSPQVCETPVQFKAVVTGGEKLVYRFVIKGHQEEDSGYTKSNSYIWESKKPGRYIIELLVKDESSEKEYEDKKTMEFAIDEYFDTPVVINEVVLDKEPKLLLKDPINIKVEATGLDLRYSFTVLLDGKEEERVDFGACNWVNFTPEKPGRYEIDIKVKSKFSKRDFDCHSIIYLEAYEFIPGEIDYIIMPIDKYYVVGDKVELTTIARNTSKFLFNYVLKINGHKAEETGFVKSSRYSFMPRCGGNYAIEIQCKSLDSNRAYDSKREVRVRINEAYPITKAHIECDTAEVYCNETVSFTARCEGGKEVMFEFYLMDHGDWNLVQNYSRKNYYTFMPFNPGKYKMLVLFKSTSKQCDYEEYKELEFEVVKRVLV